MGGGRSRGLLLLTIAALATLAVLLAPAPRASANFSCGFQTGFGSYSAGNQPGACWRPYSDSSPFNLGIPAGAPLHPDSSRIVSTLLQGGSVDDFVAGDPERDGGVPIYWSSPSDPVVQLHCVRPWGKCALEGLQIRVPAQAQPQGGYATPDTYEHDAHMTIIDQQSGWEYDLWNVVSRTGSTLNFGWGGKTRIDGDGLGSSAVAANYGTIAGPIRFAELQAGVINHALTMVVPCTDTVVYPATGRGLTCAEGGLDPSYSIPMGSHFRLAMSKRAIKKAKLPTWKKAILTALSTYGAYVSDTSGDRGEWGFERESTQSYTAYGQSDPWLNFARATGTPPEDYNGNGFQEYWMHLGDGVNWGKLRVVGLCAAQGTCPVAEKSQLRVRARACRRSFKQWKRKREHFSKTTHRTRIRWSSRCRRLTRSL
jgi:hypothetical protein